jgi:hypothetical protein
LTLLTKSGIPLSWRQRVAAKPNDLPGLPARPRGPLARLARSTGDCGGPTSGAPDDVSKHFQAIAVACGEFAAEYPADFRVIFGPDLTDGPFRTGVVEVLEDFGEHRNAGEEKG